MCEVCNKWMHIKCQDISEPEYKFLREHPRYHFYCNKCDENASSVVKILSSMKQRQTKLEEDVNKVIKNLTRIENDNTSLKDAGG